MCNYYWKFQKDYSDDPSGLAHLLTKNSKWQRGLSEEQAFANLKNRLLKTVIIKFPKLGDLFYVQADSSKRRVGGELYPIDGEGNKMVLGFCSRGL